MEDSYFIIYVSAIDLSLRSTVSAVGLHPLASICAELVTSLFDGPGYSRNWQL